MLSENSLRRSVGMSNSGRVVCADPIGGMPVSRRSAIDNFTIKQVVHQISQHAGALGTIVESPPGESSAAQRGEPVRGNTARLR